MNQTTSFTAAQSPDEEDATQSQESDLVLVNELVPRPESVPARVGESITFNTSSENVSSTINLDAKTDRVFSSDWEGIISQPFEISNSTLENSKPLSEMKLNELMRHHWNDLGDDYENFYAPQNLANLAVGFLAGGVMANSNIDTFISHDVFADNIVDTGNDEVREILHLPKVFGDGHFVLPMLGVVALSQPWLEQSPTWQPVGEWGNRSMRAALVGAPLMLISQRIIGGSRPNETNSLSHWKPFQDNNGVSGHAFVGAVPFLTAAKMSDRPLIKIACYVGSVMPGISRINDERHYTSQVALGWYIAFLATHAVDQTQTGGDGFRIFPTFDQNGIGLMFDKRF